VKTWRKSLLSLWLGTPKASKKTRGESLDVATCMKVRISAMPFCSLKNQYSCGRTGHTGGAGPANRLPLDEQRPDM